MLKVKSQFIGIINENREWWLKRDELSYALYQMFANRYGYRFTGLPAKVDENKKEYEFFDWNGKPGVFTPSLLNEWFKEWKQIELTYFED